MPRRGSQVVRILALSTHQEKCGIATYNDALMGALREQGHEVDVMPIVSAITRTKTKGDMLTHFDEVPARARNYDAVILQHEYGLFGGRHSSGFAQKVFSRVIDRLAQLGKPVAIVFHSEPKTSTRLLSKKRYYWARIRRAINESPSVFAVVHGETADRQYREAGLLAGSIWATKHPVPPPEPLPLQQDRDATTLTIFGFVAKYKGYAEAVKALDLLPENFRLVIAGGVHPGNTEDDTYEQIEALAHPRVEITGWLESPDVKRIMVRTDIVLAPYHENGPAGSGAVTWAITYGRPVIGTHTVTFEDIQKEAGCFVLVPPRDAAALAGAIKDLAENGSRRDDLVSRGFDYARKYSWDSMARELVTRLKS
jgi:glycosyltransferase involved in cell wall biosynthesis